MGSPFPTSVTGRKVGIKVAAPPSFLEFAFFSLPTLVRKLTYDQEGGLLMPKISSLVNIFPIFLSKRLEVEILVSPTYHVSAFLVTDVFDKIWDRNMLQCRWSDIHSFIF